MALVMVFWEKGYEATTQQDMIAATGLSSSSLLNTFGNKPEIFEQVLTCYLSMQRQGLSKLHESDHGLDDLLEFIDQIEAHVSGEQGCPHGCLAVKTLIGPTSTSESVFDMLQEYRSNLGSALKATLERASKRSEIPPNMVDERVQLISASIIGILATAGSSSEAGIGAIPMVHALRTMVASWRS